MSIRKDAATRRLYDFIRDYIHQHRMPPTYGEMMEGAAISSKSVVRFYLDHLERQGLLEKAPGVSRGVRLRRDSSAKETSRPALPPTVSVQTYGTIAAGLPKDTGDALEAVELPRGLLPSKTGHVYGLRVRGDSMRDAFIEDGDLVVIQHQTEARNGDMVAVRLSDGDEYTLKHFYREGNRIRLQPANPAYGPIYAHPSKVEVQGRVVLVIRRP